MSAPILECDFSFTEKPDIVYSLKCSQYTGFKMVFLMRHRPFAMKYRTGTGRETIFPIDLGDEVVKIKLTSKQISANGMNLIKSTKKPWWKFKFKEGSQ